MEQTLIDMGMRGDIIRLMHREMTQEKSAPGIKHDRFVVHGIDKTPEQNEGPIIGRVVKRGTADDEHERRYLIVEGAARCNRLLLASDDGSCLDGHALSQQNDVTGKQTRGTDDAFAFDLTEHLSYDKRSVDALSDFGVAPTNSNPQFPGGGVD